MTWYVKEYEHCGTTWTDEWCCACNDKCPACGAEIEPHDYYPAGHQGACGDANCADCARLED